MSGARVVLAVDGNSLVHRCFHSQARTGFRSADGRPRWAVRGLLSQLVAAVDRIGPDHVVVGFDDPAASVRRERWPQYKAHRTEKLATLVEQLDAAGEVLRTLGISVVVPTGWEADDVLASVARQAPAAGATTVVMTSDRDAFGLIDAHTRVLRIINGGVDASPVLTPERLVTLLGVRPEQYPDFAALRGDPSDNLPGVRGVGPRTAAKLLTALGCAEAAFDDLDAGGTRVADTVGPAVAARLATPQARAAWALNRQVMMMRDDVAVDLDAGRLPLPGDAVRAAFAEQDLPWTAATALRALAHDDSAPPPPARTDLETGWSPGASRRQRRPALPRTPVVDQLSLF
ncbi:5'-3' exonuclease [Pseudonocardia abyssalis]|uniref:5'-3' exonuclease n=1 Tax=Pseudonocardia abyssalis TaxID=2792008 RepID=A0ABS6UXP0_9PSEU|nr:5'-3' exonuclease [Pseudonocardia abyssalis]MBW0114854.1 5'-3' exonuclease [Pseudonocardia abyssalis]MBW0137044.1 5'-3' exonuclease [Pseudonocardia abyssalis]